MKRKIAALLAACLLLSLPMTALAAQPQQEETQEETQPQRQVISVATAEDLLALAENCVLDTWSQDKQVELTADICLEGTDFAPIATFGGVFDGKGHSISLNVTGSYSPAGLFGILQEGGVVQNLTVTGNISPEGDGLNAGGIAGINYGVITRCSFDGTVIGKQNTGGIAGSNYGRIENTSAAGKLTGKKRTGGIAGYHYGEIISCQNTMAVNTDSVDPTLNVKDISLDFNLDLAKTSDLDANNAASDTGGIAGYSGGTIRDSKNSGNIGYPHIGYNLGGLVGRTSGVVDGCSNTGTIQGRKDAGGIAGQMEPHVDTILSPDYLETLSQQFETLGGMVGSTGAHGANMGRDVESCVGVITDCQSQAQWALRDLIFSAGDGELNQDALYELQGAVQGMISASDTLGSVIGSGADTIGRDISAISGQITAISRTFGLATEDAKQETVLDLSGLDLDMDSVTTGFVRKCVNTGLVEADLNVGGITGIMGLESVSDPEDDTPSGKLSQRRRYELTAIVNACENAGTVTGKRHYVGGVCGRMDLGLILDCRGYGRITSEDGNYVGGITGLTAGSVRNCFAKCTLSGSSYVGGIVGSGTQQDLQGESSQVTGCYSMVDILEAKQYLGAVSGENAGVFAGNYFVSDTLAGINRVSYQGVAEPVSYEKMKTLQELPQSLRELTLRFVADGQTIKTVPFYYGDSFDARVYPEIPQKEGYYARWNIRDLTDLHFDTVVEARYSPYITALGSPQTRPDDRPVLFVQGLFQEGDALTVTPGETEFGTREGQTLLEQWHIAIPADGLESHTIRYLPGQEDVQLYLLKNGSWNRLHPEDMGTYLAFDAVGADLQIAAVAVTQEGRMFLAVIFAAAAAVLMAIILLIRRRKRLRGGGRKKHLLWLLPILLAALIGTAVYKLMPRTEIVKTLQVYQMVKAGLDQQELGMTLSVKAQIENQNADFTADIAVTQVGNHKVSVITENDRTLYFCDDVVYVENGDAFRLNAAAPDYAGLMDLVLELSKDVQMDARQTVATITAEGDQAVQLVGLLMPSVQSLLPQQLRLTVELMTQDEVLTQIQFTGAGNLDDSVKTPFSLSAQLQLQPQPPQVTIPTAVSRNILYGTQEPVEIYSDELLRLLKAWTQLPNPLAAQVAISVDCAPITLSEEFHYYAWRTAGTTIHAADLEGKMLYFGNDKVCTADGKKARLPAAQEIDVTKLADTLYKVFKSAQFQCQQTEDTSTYTVSLQPAAMKELTQAVLPKVGSRDIAYDKGSIQLVVKDEQLQSIRIISGGSTYTAALLKAEVKLTLDATLEGQAPALPDPVRTALCGS